MIQRDRVSKQEPLHDSWFQERGWHRPVGSYMSFLSPREEFGVIKKFGGEWTVSRKNGTSNYAPFTTIGKAKTVGELEALLDDPKNTYSRLFEGTTIELKRKNGKIIATGELRDMDNRYSIEIDLVEGALAFVVDVTDDKAVKALVASDAVNEYIESDKSPYNFKNYHAP